MCTSIIRLHAPLEKDNIMPLRVGDRVLLSGVIYTARDAAHKKMFEAIESGKDLPFDIKGAVIYYAGPTPARPGDVFGRGIVAALRLRRTRKGRRGNGLEA